MTASLIIIIALALIFDYINGFHDAANSIATVVSTKVLTPFQAVVWAAVFNFAAFFIFKDHGVANTIAVNPTSKSRAACISKVVCEVKEYLTGVGRGKALYDVVCSRRWAYA